MTSSIANETVDHSKNREPFSFYKFITNKYFLNVVSIVLFLALWDYVAKEKIFRDSLARPLEVVDQLYRLTYMKFAGTNLIGHIWASTQRVLIGFIAASVVAVPLGLFMALNKYVNAIVKPLFDLFKPMPPIAWVSIAILWFGIGEKYKYFLIFIAAFVPFTLNAFAGASHVDKQLVGAARMLGASKSQLFFEIVVPAAVPSIFSGAQVALSNSWMTMLAAEMVCATEGVGWIIIAGQSVNDMTQMIAGMLAIGIVGLLLAIGMRKLEERCLIWNNQGK